MSAYRPFKVGLLLVASNLAYQGLTLAMDKYIGSPTLKATSKIFDPANAIAVKLLWADCDKWAEPTKYWVEQKSLQIGLCITVGLVAKESTKASLYYGLGLENAKPEWFVPLKLLTKLGTKGFCKAYVPSDPVCQLAGEMSGNIFQNLWQGKGIFSIEDFFYSLTVAGVTSKINTHLDAMNLAPFSRSYQHNVCTSTLRSALKRYNTEDSGEKYQGSSPGKYHTESQYKAIRWTEFPSKEYEKICLKNYLEARPEEYKAENEAIEGTELSAKTPQQDIDLHYV